MKRSKWVAIKSPREKVHRACARMLTSRIEALAYYLPLAAGRAEENVEYVHQLRVWTRRTEAALDLCRYLLAKSDRKKLAQRLQLLRSVGGTARDIDVLRQSLLGLRPCAAREFLLAKADQRRTAAQQPIAAASQALKGGARLLDQLHKVLKRIKRKRGQRTLTEPVGKWATRELRPLVKKFFRRGKKDLSDVRSLHKFRIAGKRLRYAMELVGKAFDKRFRKRLYAELDRLQTRLGAINDLANLVAELECSFSKIRKRALKTELNSLLAEHRKRLAVARKAWNAFWSDDRIEKLQRHWKKYV